MAESKKKSIFAQRMQKRKDRLQNHASTVSERKIRKNMFGDKSYIVTGEEATLIHNENVNKLLSMSEEEIIQEREKIIAELEPGIVKFLQDRRKKEEKTNKVDVNMVEDSDCDANTFTDNISKIRLEYVNEVKELAYKYPHMDVVEDDKLKWIGELPNEVKIPKDPYPARFNFEGRLLPYCDKGEGVLKGLHNHGDEPERPGYSLQELIQLSRSTVLQQRVIAINTLANIMANASNYDECFDMPLLPALLEADTFLLLRFSLDDPAQPVIAAAAAAISNLIVNHLDELCLDILLGTPLGIQQPSFGVVLDVSKEDVAELKDQELLKLDIIKGALRTDLLTRIKYILVDLTTEPVEIKHMLKTITRIARHSYETADMVFKCPGLLAKVRTLVDKGDEGSYYPEALKLFRILSARSNSLAATIASEFRVLEVLFSFIAGDRAQRHPETMQLTLESFYIWQTFLNYNISLETIGKCSWLIRGKIVSCPENLPCLGSVPPTVREESSLPFVYALATYL